MRKTYIDNLRIFVSILVVIYHVIWIFNGVQQYGPAMIATEFRGQDALLYFLYPWFMCIFFIISGMSAKWFLDNHTEKEFLSARTNKLLVPSTIGVLLFGWIQGYVNMKLGGAFENMPEIPAFINFIIMDLSGIGVLWTMQMLWLFSVLLLFVRKIEKSKFVELCKNANLIIIILLGVFAWLFAQILNTPVIAVYRFGIYGFCFFAGYFVFCHDDVIFRLEKFCIPLLAVAAGLLVVYTVIYFGKDYSVSPVVNNPLAISSAWFSCLALLGIFKKYFDKENSFTRFMKKRSFGLYVFHYLGLSAAALLIKKNTSLNGILVYLIGASSACAIGFGLGEIVPKIPFIRWVLLGIKKKKS